MRIVVVDDHLMFAQVLAKQCKDEGHSVMAVETSATSGVQSVKSHLPDLLITDLVLPDLDGFATIRACRKHHADLRVLVVSSRLDMNTAYQIERLHCQGFVGKICGFNEFRIAVREIAAGRVYFSKGHCDMRNELWSVPNSFPKVLSEWQQTIVMEVGSLRSDREISRTHGVSEAAVVKLKQRAARRLGLGSVAELMGYARRLGLYSYSP